MLETIKALLGIADTSKDTILNFHISSVQQKIMATCFIDVFPTALETVAIEIVVNRMKGVSVPIKSIQRGDTKTEYRDADELEPYQSQLAYHKRVKSL